MKSITLLTASLFFSFSGATYAAEPYIGQFLYQYEGAGVYRVTVKDAKSMTWLCIDGPEKGANGVETPDRFKVANKVYFASWVEKTGINVTQVVNLNTMKVYSTILDGKERYVVSGNIVREK
ncbi:MoaF C-terminal domain-containing protein [Methylophilus sp. 5]|uniref:MoaF-related domain-containing protein n=1 Tax=Methylophilus sp. 5 TaxID=1112274 RepID=UPI00048FC198|nr:MoaF C-terminal domain-containing protein [Methylophilus sp. 5]